MKRLFNFFFVTLFGINVLGQTEQTQTGNTDNIPSPTPQAIVSRDANSRLWQWTTYELSPSGQVVPHLHHYTELASGLCYQQNGQWVDSQEQINIQPDGSASATAGQHQAYFPANIYNGSITLVTPDGLQLQSQPLGLFYDDGDNTVMIAALTNSVGQLISSNQVIYTNAFTGVDADLLYTYRKSGFEQDIIFRQQPPAPEQFGLSSGNTRLQMLTEFFNPPEPVENTSAANPADGLQDTTLAFGQTRMIPGKAFLAGDTSQSEVDPIPVYKSWVNVDGRKFLVEQMPYQRISTELETLPQMSSVAVNATVSASHKTALKRWLPPVHLAVTKNKSLQLAKANYQGGPGVVLDYVTMNGSIVTNFTFRGDTTYFISGGCSYVGTTILEGGTVIKMNSGGFIEPPFATDTIDCQTASYRPAVFTSYNDNTVGETISGSSGSPAHNDVGNFIIAQSTNLVLGNVRFSYCGVPISQSTTGSSLEVWDSQFNQVNSAISAYNLGVYNVLIHSVLTHGQIIGVQGPNFVGEQMTVDGKATLIGASTTNTIFALTNCIITTTNSTYTLTSGGSALHTNDVAILIQPSVPVYQTVGAGSYYLTNGSPYRGQGTTIINSNLLVDLAQKTTYPPVVFSNTAISYATNFMPQALRDNGGANVDLGYHYDPIDYAFGGVNAATNITFSAGTVMAWFELPGLGGAGYGIALPDSSIVTFNGTATAPCFDARYDTVQEGGNGLWTDKGYLGSIIANGTIGSDTNVASGVNAQFTRFAELEGDPNDVCDYTSDFILQARHCEFWSGQEGGYGIHDELTNCLFNGTPIAVQAASSGDSALVMENCTMREGYILANHWSGSTWPVWIENSAYEGTDLTGMDDPSDGSNYIYCDYNAFLTNDSQLPFEGTNTVVVTNGYNWQTSWFGSFYLSTNSPIIKKGSTTADQVGLYEFTTQTNQIPESTNVVDIGYHYVATDQYGNPLDSNNDGYPNYLEDINGNGVYGPGDLADWNFAINTNVPAGWYEENGLNPDNPLTGIQDADWDGLLNQQEYLYGTDPQVSQGFTIWVCTPNGSSSIP